MALCDTPSVVCNRWDLQSPAAQQYLLIHLLASTLGVSTDDGDLKDLAAGYLCQGSPAKLQLEAATAIVGADLDGVDLTKLGCWSPLELSAVTAYLVCRAIDAL